MKKVALVVGVAGFLGSAIARELLERGIRVVGVDSMESGSYKLVHKLMTDFDSFTFEPAKIGEITDRAAYYDYVLNFTSPCSNVEFMENDREAKVLSMKNFTDGLYIAHKTKARYIYPSTSSLYAENPNEYAKTKMQMEAIQQLIGHRDITAFRIFAGYGETEKHKGRLASVVYQFTNSILRGETIQVYGDGTQSRDFVYVKDVAKVIADNLDTESRIIDVGSTNSIKLNDLIFMIEALSGNKATVDYIISPQKNYLEHTKMTGRANCHTKIEDGIMAIIEAIRLDLIVEQGE